MNPEHNREQDDDPNWNNNNRNNNKTNGLIGNKSSLNKAIETDETTIAALARENELLRAQINARTEAIQESLFSGNDSGLLGLESSSKKRPKSESFGSFHATLAELAHRHGRSSHKWRLRVRGVLGLRMKIGYMLKWSTDFQNVTVFLVSFKTCVREFILGVRVPSQVNRGDMVIVSADRGEDLGLVSEVLPLEQYLRQYFPQMLHNPLFNVNKHFGRILRLATAREVRMLSMKLTAEQQAIEFCEHLAYNVYGLPVRIVDAEFQFDRHKITVYYEASLRADFRGFVKDMYDRYKARVWLQRAV
eukprot:gene22124-28229_t